MASGVFGFRGEEPATVVTSMWGGRNYAVNMRERSV
jgi:hypothetical protein